MSNERASNRLPKRHATQKTINSFIFFSENQAKILFFFFKTEKMQLIEDLMLGFRKIKKLIPKRRKKSSSENELDNDFIE